MFCIITCLIAPLLKIGIANFETARVREMITQGYYRRLFLSGMGSVYLMAFMSYYLQFPGLYGNNGILPVASHLGEVGDTSKEINWQRDVHHWWNKPTLAVFAPSLQVDPSVVVEGCALLGVVLSTMAVGGCHHCLLFGMLFVPVAVRRRTG